MRPEPHAPLLRLPRYPLTILFEPLSVHDKSRRSQRRYLFSYKFFYERIFRW